VLKTRLMPMALLLACAHGVALAATGEPKAGEVAKADKQRTQPLQRCDQLSDKAELDCLHKARERIVEARQKREASAKGGDQAARAKPEQRKDR
jgi:hypothetical protein